jgi:hypothetical protein
VALQFAFREWQAGRLPYMKKRFLLGVRNINNNSARRRRIFATVDTSRDYSKIFALLAPSGLTRRRD